ncbi:LPS translocon maturation chaperone LptM [Photobacterium sp.]|nr:lipoprotein [Photobacterium sp.]MDX1303934.1 lipoprotein [Photobacterium sp.]
MRKGLLAIFVLSILALAGCGQSGGLYMPDDSQQQEQQP